MRLCLLLAVIVATTGVEGITYDNVIEPIAGDLPNWMERMGPYLAQKPFRNLRIIGTHQSSSYSLIAPSGWTVCQNVGVYYQLLGGVRYLDVRVGYWGAAPNPTLRSGHGGFYGADVETIFGEIRSFLRQYQKELVIVQLGQENGHDVRAGDKQPLVDMIRRILGEYMVNSSDTWFSDSAVVGDFWSRPSKRLIFLFGSNLYPSSIPNEEAAKRLGLWPHSLITAGQWPEATSQSIMIEVANNVFNEYQPESRGPYRIQMILTPFANVNNNDAAARILPLSDLTGVMQADQTLQKWFDSHKNGRINVLTVDYVFGVSPGSAVSSGPVKFLVNVINSNLNSNAPSSAFVHSPLEDPTCDCNYHPGGCSISRAAPSKSACKCVYLGAWTCGGQVVRCSNPNSPLCTNPDTSQAACVLGGGDCDGYGAQGCDCNYHPGGCSISKAPPKNTACKCVYQGAWTCGGQLVRCSNENSRLCSNPDTSQAACLLGGGDCDGYSGRGYTCDCNYHPGGCSLSTPAPRYSACKCVYQGAWTCGGQVVRCSNENSRLCSNPDTSQAACLLGGGDCSGYGGSQSCDCDYGRGGCKISRVAPKYSACKCIYKGFWTCGGEVVRCRDESSTLCADPDRSSASCHLGGGDCGAY